MRLDNRIILGSILVLTAVLFPFVAFSSGLPRIILSSLCMLFFPGYALLSALFPRQGDLGIVERIALSFGLSIAVVPLTGFILNFTPWGIRLYPVLISLALFILLTSAAAFVRSCLLPAESRLNITLSTDFPRWGAISKLNKGLLVAGALVAVSIVGIVLYSAVSLPPTQQPTEFYILNSEGKAENYPRQAKINDWLTIRGVVVNHENGAATYIVSAIIAGDTVSENTTGLLAPGEKWEGNLGFTAKTAGENQKIDFYLYKDNEKEPYFKDPLYIYVDVSNP